MKFCVITTHAPTEVIEIYKFANIPAKSEWFPELIQFLYDSSIPGIVPIDNNSFRPSATLPKRLKSREDQSANQKYVSSTVLTIARLLLDYCSQLLMWSTATTTTAAVTVTATTAAVATPRGSCLISHTHTHTHTHAHTHLNTHSPR